MAKETITIDQPSPAFGDPITFTVDPADTQGWVHLTAIQDGVLVFDAWTAPAGNTGETIPLGPSELWTGGAATATASLVEFDKHGNPHTLASVTFAVAA